MADENRFREIIAAEYADFRKVVTLQCADMVESAKCEPPRLIPEGDASYQYDDYGMGIATGYAYAKKELAAMLRVVANGEIIAEMCEERHKEN